MKKKYILISVAVIIILAAVAGGYFASFAEKEVPEKETKNSGEKAVLTVIFSEEDTETFEIVLNENSTALNLLKNSGLDMEIKEYDFGAMVESINNKKNGEDSKYWLYYVNGETPMVSVDKYEIKAGDKVDFKFEASPF